MRAGHRGRALDPEDSFSKLTVHLGLPATDEVGACHHDEIDSGAARARQPSEALSQQPAGAVSLDRSADATAHRQAETVEGAAVGCGHQEE